MKKKVYIKPEIKRMELDRTISMLMMSPPKSDFPERQDGAQPGTGNPRSSDPFASPFNNKPFN
jgi:hypothetical protein